jgi:S-adenosylmethionine synthetase
MIYQIKRPSLKDKHIASVQVEPEDKKSVKKTKEEIKETTKED